MIPFKLCIDPGHGARNSGPGFDPGAESGGMRECDIALAWGLTLKFYLVEAGIPHFLTRDDNTDPDPVGTRDDRAEMAGCTHFLSIHCNCATGKATGTETFYRDAADKGWAQLVQRCGIRAMGLKDRGLKTEADSQHSKLAIFDFDGPAALLETGFIDSLVDRSKIALKETRIAFARNLIAAIKATYLPTTS